MNEWKWRAVYEHLNWSIYYILACFYFIFLIEYVYPVLVLCFLFRELVQQKYSN